MKQAKTQMTDPQLELALLKFFLRLKENVLCDARMIILGNKIAEENEE